MPFISMTDCLSTRGTIYQMRDVIKSQLVDSDGPQELNMLDYLSRTALELIGQAGLGYSFNALDMEKENTFATAAKQFQYAALNTTLPETNLQKLIFYLGLP